MNSLSSSGTVQLSRAPQAALAFSRIENLITTLSNEVLMSNNNSNTSQIDRELINVLVEHKLTSIVMNYFELQFKIIPQERICLADVPTILFFQIAQFLHDGKSLCRLLINLAPIVRLNIFRSHLGEVLINSILRAARGNFANLPPFIKTIFNDSQVKARVSELNLNDCPLDCSPDTFQKLFQFFPYIKNLELENSSLTGKDINFPIAAFRLTTLSLGSNCRILTVPSETFQSRHIRHLDLGGCIGITGEAICDIIRRLPLEHLSLAGCIWTTNITLDFITRCLQDLKFLDLFGCWRITDHGVRSIADNLPTLTHLDLGRCRDLTDQVALSLFRIRSLEFLSLTYCQLITEGAVGDIASRCLTLKNLDLFNCNINIDNIINTRHDLPKERESLLRNSCGIKNTRDHDILIYPESIIRFGFKLIQQGNLIKARRCFERALNIDPNNALARAALGSGQEDHVSMTARLKEAVNDNPSDVDGLIFLAGSLEEQGDLVRAKAFYEQAIKLEPMHGLACTSYAVLLFSEGDLINARLFFERALITQPNDPHPLANLGGVLYAQKDLINARTRLERALAVDPEYEYALVTLSNVLFEQKDFVAARTLCERAFAINPNNPVTLLLLGRLLYDQGDMVKAKSFLEQTLAIEPENASALLILGVILYHQGELVKARNCLEHALAIKISAHGLYLVGVVMADQGDLEYAKIHLEWSLALKPNNAKALTKLSEVLQRQGVGAR